MAAPVEKRDKQNANFPFSTIQVIYLYKVFTTNSLYLMMESQKEFFTHKSLLLNDLEELRPPSHKSVYREMENRISQLKEQLLNGVKTPIQFLDAKSVEVGSFPTDVLCSRFDERLFIVVSQYKKIGNLVSITRDTVADDFQSVAQSFRTKILLGKDQPLTHVIAKNLISKIDVDKPIFLSFSLKDTSARTVLTLSNIIKELK